MANAPVIFPRLASKTVLITGASAGIGRAAALVFAQSSANVVMVARRADKLAELDAEIKKTCPSVKTASIPLDVTDKAAVDGLLGKIPPELLPVDILVNNAGGVRGREHVGDISYEDVETMLDLNVKSLVHITQTFVREFKKQQNGHVIMLGSIAGREPYAGGSIYTASKHAVRAFTGSLMRELVNTPIRVSEVQPGMVETEFSVVRYRGDVDRANAEYKGIDPLTGQDVAEELAWVASRPAHVNVAEVLVFPAQQASATINYRRPQ